MQTTRDSLVLDDLSEGGWYRFTTRLGLETEGQFLGYDGCYALLREEGSLRAEPWPTTFLARCRIEALYTPVEIIDPEYEPLAEARERLDAADPQGGARAVVVWILAGALAWAALLLWAFPIGR